MPKLNFALYPAIFLGFIASAAGGFGFLCGRDYLYFGRMFFLHGLNRLQIKFLKVSTLLKSPCKNNLIGMGGKISFHYSFTNNFQTFAIAEALVFMGMCCVKKDICEKNGMERVGSRRLFQHNSLTSKAIINTSPVLRRRSSKF